MLVRPLAGLALIALAAFAVPAFSQALKYPEAPRKAVTDTYHGVPVVDEYRWLENGKDPAVRAWSEAQLAVTRSALDGPLRSELHARFQDLLGTAPLRYYAFHATSGGLFAMKSQPPRNQPSLVVIKSPADMKSERVLIDLNALDGKGTTAIDFFEPSRDGRYVAVVLSEKGSEDGSAHVIDTRTGQRLADVVPRVQYPTGGGSIAWNRKGTGFFYTRYPQGNERAKEDVNFYQQVWFHKLGTPPAADTYAIGKEFPRIAETDLEAAKDSDHILATVANGDGGEYAFYLRHPKGHWTKVADFADKIKRMHLGRDGRLYAISRQDAPRGKVIALSLSRPDLANAVLVVPQGEDTVEALKPARDRLYVSYMAGGPSEIRIFDLGGKSLGKVPTEPVSNVSLSEVLDNGEVLVGTQSYMTPPAVHLYSPKSTKLERTALANVRGGGEFGEAWHLAGNLTKKQNVFDDMIGAAQHLVDRGYTSPAKLAAMGGSNGGLLMGAILTQRPDLFRAIVSSVGIYDMLRVELTPNGAFNVTEFGTVKDPEQFKALMAYSPYHRVKSGTAYPAVLFVTGENDGRVDPYNSRKMAALMQAANASKNPVLLRVNFVTGHGQGSSLAERIEQNADVYAFLMGQLGMQ